MIFDVDLNLRENVKAQIERNNHENIKWKASSGGENEIIVGSVQRYNDKSKTAFMSTSMKLYLLLVPVVNLNETLRREQVWPDEFAKAYLLIVFESIANDS